MAEYRLEQAQNEPDALNQDYIKSQMSPQEWQRLSRVRNIGIAVCIKDSK
jgi:hypothetical protein